jgi:serine/threonine protein kinase
MVLVITDLEETAPKRKLCIACKQEFSGDEITCPNDGTTLTHLTMEASIGSTIGEKYEILAVIGGGAMGLVYKARHTLMKRVVAVKMLHPNMLPDAGTVMRFKKEAEALSCLNHPNILTVFDFGISTQGQPYLVTDYLEGQTLGELLESSQLVPWQRTVQIFMQVCSALSHAHKNGVIHRDIKPSNIMLTEFEDQQDFVKILDFGIAKVITEETENSSQLTRTGEVFGSPLYMSPEQCRGKSLDARSDIYSLGCVMFRTLTGQPAFFGQDLVECLYKHVNEAAPSLREIAPEADIPEDLELVVLKCLNKDQNDRYQTMSELKEALANTIGVSAITSTSLEIVPRPSGQTMVNSAIQEMSTGGINTPPSLSATGSSALETTNPDPLVPPAVPQSTDEKFEGTTSGSDWSAKPGLLQDKRAVIAGAVLVLLLVGIPLIASLNKNNGVVPVTTTTTATPNDVSGTATPVTFDDKLERGIDEYELGDYDESQDIISDAIRQGRKENVGPDKLAEALHYMVNASIGANEDTEAEAFVSQLEHDAKIDGKDGPPTTMAQAKAYLDRAALLMTHNNEKDDTRARKLLTLSRYFLNGQKQSRNHNNRPQTPHGVLELS